MSLRSAEYTLAKKQHEVERVDVDEYEKESKQAVIPYLLGGW